MTHSQVWRCDILGPLPDKSSRTTERMDGRPYCREGTPDAGVSDAAMNAFPHDEVNFSKQDFDVLVTRHEKRIFNLIYRILGDYEEAADLTQETFISAFKNIDKFRGDSKIFTWLYQIARNLCINRLRQRERQKVIRVESLDQPWDNNDDGKSGREIADYSHAPHQALEDKELGQRIHAAIDSLPSDYREVVILREYEQLSYNEIVEITGLTLENVKTRLSRARAMLRRKLEPYYHT